LRILGDNRLTFSDLLGAFAEGSSRDIGTSPGNLYSPGAFRAYLVDEESPHAAAVWGRAAQDRGAAITGRKNEPQI